MDFCFIFIKDRKALSVGLRTPTILTITQALQYFSTYNICVLWKRIKQNYIKLEGYSRHSRQPSLNKVLSG